MFGPFGGISLPFVSGLNCSLQRAGVILCIMGFFYFFKEKPINHAAAQERCVTFNIYAAGVKH